MNILGNVFNGPHDHTRGFNNAIAAVYVIIDAYNGQNYLLDVGQTGDLNNRFPNHPREASWIANKAGDLSLWILGVSNEQDRLTIESQIRTSYNPPCGDR